jgi:Zn-dependent M28 family amino/carboxypeptidase
MALALFVLVAVLDAAVLQQRGTSTFVDEVAKMAAAATNEERFDAVTAMLKARNLPFVVEPFTIDKPIEREPRTEARNIVVTVGDGKERLVIGAHYDAARLGDGALSRGVVDNAASSVILIHLAELLRTEKLPMRVSLVWFDMEELGLIGSTRYVQRHASDTPVAMLNFDINAYGNTVLFGPSERPESAALRQTLVQTCAGEGIACVASPQMPPGDDRPFVKAGVPTLSIAVLPAIEAHQVWLMMNAGAKAGLAPGTMPAILQTIHTAEDTLDKVDDAAMTMMLRFAASLVRGIIRGRGR